MNKRVLFVSCEGVNAKTEENFLKHLYNDIDVLVEINQIKDIHEIQKLKTLKFDLKSINHSNLKMLLDSNPAYSRIIVFVDNDVKCV